MTRRQDEVGLVADPRRARLRFVTDDARGYRRVRRGKGFRYVDPSGRPAPEAVRRRARALAVPPAWTDVWISASPNGHLQATGRDARGRKQYRYHPAWRAARDGEKYAKLAHLGKGLPRLRRRVRADLRKRDVPREKVLATVVRLIEETASRVGNDEYARANRSYGLTTLRDRHARISRGKVRLRYRGKSGTWREASVEDPTLAGIVRRCQALPGQRLFQYRDGDGRVREVTSQDVNAYLRETVGDGVTAKDLRTWTGTVLVARELGRRGPPRSERHAKRGETEAIDRVARELGNTRAVCRASYVHPLVFEAYRDGRLRRAFAAARNGRAHEERALLRLLKGERRRPA